MASRKEQMIQLGHFLFFLLIGNYFPFQTGKISEVMDFYGSHNCRSKNKCRPTEVMAVNFKAPEKQTHFRGEFGAVYGERMTIDKEKLAESSVVAWQDNYPCSFIVTEFGVLAYFKFCKLYIQKFSEATSFQLIIGK